MIKLSIFEFFCRGIPEAFVFVLASLLFTKKIIDKKKLIISSILYAIIIYLVRLLPIHLGVHSIILTIIYPIISVFINKININQSIFCTLIEFVILSICELTNLFALSLLNVDIKIISLNPVKKVLYFLPSLILFSGIVALFYIVFYKNRRVYLSIQK
ncbi:hypothetical protein [Clostridium scatologenes]|uniref:Uncharacterized protein n=1 Tax=Clostridium scatologenes TaxID=1548 RepID=A0A0E3JP70_CLOSL|nr:hypothetical protein [Clostridium scatologenes]AKA70073.1 hypothetical protein CSCA_2948 [Clostridium scatologenes]